MLQKLQKIEETLTAAANIFDKLYGDDTGLTMRNKCREAAKLAQELIQETIDVDAMCEMSENNEDDNEIIG